MKKKVALVFPRELVGEPITYKLIKDYNLIINILKAKIIPYKEGKLDVEISGEKDNLNRGINYLTKLGVKIEPLAQQIKWDKDKCVCCTVCVALCPVDAFEVEKKEGIVSFNEEKCIVCGICALSCPYRAIEILF